MSLSVKDREQSPDKYKAANKIVEALSLTEVSLLRCEGQRLPSSLNPSQAKDCVSLTN